MESDQKEHFRRALFAARVERDKLLKEARELDKYREALEFYIHHVEQSIHGLCVLLGEDELATDEDKLHLAGLPLADACRKIMEATNRFMTPIRVRNGLRLAKYSLKEHKNPLAAIHGVLKRFEESGEAESLKIAGKTGYRLKRSDAADCDQKHEKKARKLKGKSKKEVIDVSEVISVPEMPLLLTEGSLKN